MGSVFDDANKEASEHLDSEVEIPVYQEIKISEIEEEKKSDIVSADKEVEITVVLEEKEVEIPVVSDAMKSEIQVKLGENVSDEAVIASSVKKYRVVFVLGGPGGGKSTQCANISKEIGFTHLSSGDLLRKASQIDPENGPMIQKLIKEGESVPPELTMVILMKAIENSGNDKFILDGFPRDEEIRAAFEFATKTEPELVLFFDCSEDEREKRILSRNQGRVDDNPESIRKRFKYFEEHTLPVVEYYRSKDKVYKIDASKSVEEVAATIKSLLTKTVVEVEGDVQANDADLEIRKMKLLSI